MISVTCLAVMNDTTRNKERAAFDVRDVGWIRTPQADDWNNGMLQPVNGLNEGVEWGRSGYGIDFHLSMGTTSTKEDREKATTDSHGELVIPPGFAGACVITNSPGKRHYDCPD